jgi:hypothetical protein
MGESMTEQFALELVNPEGSIQSQPFTVKPHNESLENKTILLHWNSKHNGDLFLNKIGELLAEKIKGVKIIKGWEVTPETSLISGNLQTSKKNVGKLATFKPDMVIASQAD